MMEKKYQLVAWTRNITGRHTTGNRSQTDNAIDELTII